MQFFPVEICDYFMKIVKDMVQYREENNVTRGDFLDILIALKNNKELGKFKDQQAEDDLAKFMSQIGKKLVKKETGNKTNNQTITKQKLLNTGFPKFSEITIELIAAQCFIFFIGGFESSASTLMYMLFELAQHPDVQNKVRQEILTTLESNGGEMTYEMMTSLTYLNMVIDGRKFIVVNFQQKQIRTDEIFPYFNSRNLEKIPHWWSNAFPRMYRRLQHTRFECHN